MLYMTNRKFTHSARRRDTVKCECGAEITLTHDGLDMSHAIEVHVALHMQRAKAPEGAAAVEEAERVRADLITQALIKASEL